MLAKFPKSETVSSLVAISGVKADEHSHMMKSIAETIRHVSQRPEITTADPDALVHAVTARMANSQSVAISGLMKVDPGQSVNPISGGGAAPKDRGIT